MMRGNHILSMKPALSMKEGRNRCVLCDRLTTNGEYCSAGCRRVSEELGGDNVETGGRNTEEAPEDDRRDYTEAFLRVDGMYSVTSEKYLERLGKKTSGVHEVEASYVTETAKVLYDAESISEEEVCDALSKLGHTVYPRNTEKSETYHRDRGAVEGVTGTGKRRDEPMLEIKHTVGIVISGFLLIPYVALVYPGYILSLFDTEMGYSLASVEGSAFLSLYLGLTGIVLYFTGMPFLRGAYISLVTRTPNSDLVVSLTVLSAYIYGTVSALTGGSDIYYDLTMVITSVVVSAVFYEASVKKDAVELLTDLTSSEVDEACLWYENGDRETVPTEDLQTGDRILVREGERVPVDGTVDRKECMVNESVITGESLPVSKQKGDEVIGGSVLTNGAAVVRVDGDVSGGIRDITADVWETQTADHGVQRRVDRTASIGFLVVFVLGITAGAAYFAAVGEPAESALITLTFFLVGSPWGLGLVAPVSAASSIRRAMEEGIVVFDETLFEKLRNVETVVFDKTGTLTTGKMTVVDSHGSADALRSAASVEVFASHPVAEAIADEFEEGTEVEEFESFATGVAGKVENEKVLVGDTDLFEEQGWQVPEDIARHATDAKNSGRLPVIVGREGEAEAVIVLSDEPREGWAETVTRLKEKGMKVVVLTGDSERATRLFDGNEGVDTVFADVPPEGKKEAIRRLSEGGKVAMVGDGTNDAPALAQADFSVSMGGGTALASDAADLAVTEGDISLVERAFELSDTSHRRYRQNLWLSFSYVLITVPLAVSGFLNSFFTVSAAIFVFILLLVNSYRPLL